MKNGYKIYWTSHALSELKQTIQYLEDNWTEKELQKLASELDYIIELISKNPKLFPLSKKKKGVRKVVVKKYNNLYYQFKADKVKILSFFSNRQSPDKIKI